VNPRARHTKEMLRRVVCILIALLVSRLTAGVPVDAHYLWPGRGRLKDDYGSRKSISLNTFSADPDPSAAQSASEAQKDPEHLTQQAEHMEAAFKELTRSLESLQARAQFLATRSEKTRDETLSLATRLKTESMLKSQENANAIKLLTVAEEKLSPDVAQLDASLKALNGTITAIATNMEVAERLDKLEKRMDSANGIFALLKPELKKIKSRVDTIDDHLAGNFTTVLASVVGQEANKFLAERLHNATEVFRNATHIDATLVNGTQANGTQANATQVNATDSE